MSDVLMRERKSGAGGQERGGLLLNEAAARTRGRIR
jgi:hypothetical protein